MFSDTLFLFFEKPTSQKLENRKMDLPSLPFHLVKQLWTFLDRKTFHELLDLYPVWLRRMDFEVYCFEDHTVSLEKHDVMYPDVFGTWCAYV